MSRGKERGQSTPEYAGAILLLAAVVAVLAATAGDAIARAVAGAVERAFCAVRIDGECGGATGDAAAPGEGLSPEERVARLEERAERRRDHLLIESEDAAGSRFADLHRRIEEAIAAGDLDEAERLDALLEMYAALARGEDFEGSDRGALIEDLWQAPEGWREAVEHGTFYFGENGDNARFFDMAPSPGDGLLVFDFFIPFETSGQPPVKLKGDDRDFHPGGPLASDLPLTESRILIVLDRESGRGVIYQSHTCNVFNGQCREARPIALSLDERTQFVPQLSDDVRGPYIAPTNRYEIDSDGDSIRLRYDALNSMTWPVISVDGDIELERGADGRYRIGADERDEYPSIGIYQYRPGDEAHVIDERPSIGVSPGAVPDEWDPWVPDFD